MELTFGPDKGATRVVGMRAEHCCEVMLDGAVIGVLLGGGGLYEYRGQAVGKQGLEWVTGVSSREVVGKLLESLKG